MWVLFWKETCSFFDSLIAYVVMGVFLTSLGVLLWVFPESNVLDYGYADLSMFFTLCPYVLMFLIPAITMRSFAEEKRNKTLELLLTAPLNEWQIAGGKYMAALFLVLFSLLPSLLYAGSLYALGSPVGNLDLSQVWGSYVGLVLLSTTFCAIGVCTSALCAHQVVAFVWAAFACFVAYAGFSSLASLGSWGSWGDWGSWGGGWLEDWSLLAHYEALGRGLLDSREMLYFLSASFLILALTGFILRLSR